MQLRPWSLFLDWLVSLVLEPLLLMVADAGVQVISAIIEEVEFGGTVRSSKSAQKWKQELISRNKSNLSGGKL